MGAYKNKPKYLFQDCEAIWNKRDAAVWQLCTELGVVVVERISHTLWNPFEIIEANGDCPPTTYEMFLVRELFVLNAIIVLLSLLVSHCLK